MNKGIKQKIYDNYLHLLHLNEQKADKDIETFFKQAKMEEIEHVPTNMTSIHVIACIGENQPINNITIARKMNLSKANITKINTKLLKENLIIRFQSVDNKKEVYYQLTPAGQSLCELHQKIHDQKENEFYQFVDSFSEIEQNAILKFLQNINDKMLEK